MIIRTQKIVGIDFSENAIRIVKTNAKGRILRAGLAELPVHLHGEILPEQAEEYETVLLSTMRRAAHNSKVGGGKCAICIGGPDIILRQFVLPYMDTAALSLNVIHEIQAYIALSPDMYYIDHKVHSFIESPDGSLQLKVLVAAVQKDKVDRILNLVKQCGFTPLYVDVLENAREKLINLLTNGVDLRQFDPLPVVLAKGRQSDENAKLAKKMKRQSKKHVKPALTLAPSKDAPAQKGKKKEPIVVANPDIINAAVISFGTHSTNVTIILGRRYYVSRYFNTGTFALDEVIGSIEGVNTAHAASLRRNAHYFDENTTDAAAPQVHTLIESLASEIISVIDYSFYRERTHKVDRVFISGNIAQMNGIVPFFSELFSMPVYQLDASVSPLFSKRLTQKSEVSVYTNALGATLREVSV